MNKQEIKDKVREEAREICKMIGCSGMSKACKESPQDCTIINKIMNSRSKN